MSNAFQSMVGGVSINFDTIPDLQPKAIRGIIKTQSLPEENVLGRAIETIPVADKMFKARIDDALITDMTPEVSMNSDDPMVADNWRWRSDRVNEYRQACKINREIGEQLLSPDGDPRRYAGQAELQRLIGRVVKHIDNRREYNRGTAIKNAFEFDPSRKADLLATNTITIASADEKFDNYTYDSFGNLKSRPFNVIGAAANRLAFISGKNPDSLIVTPDVLTALENINAIAKTNELTPPRVPGARYTCRNLQVFVSQRRIDIGAEEKAQIRTLFDNEVIIASLDVDTIAENQYDINRVEQFTTADQLFYYVRYWHKSKVHISRPINFLKIKNVLSAPYAFDNANSFKY